LAGGRNLTAYPKTTSEYIYKSILKYIMKNVSIGRNPIVVTIDCVTSVYSPAVGPVDNLVNSCISEATKIVMAVR
jgi:hypothetical protein